MKRHLTAALVAASFAIAMPAWAGESHHSHPANADPYAALQLDAGRKWATDEPLRRHMGELRNALARDAGQTRTSDQYKSLGLTVERSVASIVTDCKLEPRADENLHVIVAELAQAADQLQGKSKAKPSQGAKRAARALDMYAGYFDHPGFKPVTAR